MIVQFKEKKNPLFYLWEWGDWSPDLVNGIPMDTDSAFHWANTHKGLWLCFHEGFIVVPSDLHSRQAQNTTYFLSVSFIPSKRDLD